MRHSFKVGFSFGLTSGIITTLGLIVGLHASTHSRIVVIGGILIIAITDALSDAMGIHMAEESEGKHSTREIWESTISTFLTKFIFALTFIVPVLLLPLATAIIVCVLWGVVLITLFSLYLARQQGAKFWKVALEHLLIIGLVISVTHYVGNLINKFCQ